MREYKTLLGKILTEGKLKGNRTNTPALSVFGHQSVYDLRDGFPLLSLKKVSYKNVLTELIWMLNAETNIKYLQEHGCNIWNDWADENGDLGPIYGKQWEGQIDNVIKTLKSNPNCRRMVVSAWNVQELDKMALHPCHAFFQFYADGEYLDLMLTQRSADVFLGVPYNIASYATLLSIIAKITGYTPRRFVHAIGDAHIYTNHIDQCREMVCRETLDRPTLTLSDNIKCVKNLTHDMFILDGYQHHGVLKGDVAV